jgi:hypothetical protein
MTSDIVFAREHAGGGHKGGFAQHPNHPIAVHNYPSQWPATMKASTFHPVTHSLIQHSPTKITKTAISHPITNYHPNVIKNTTILNPAIKHPNVVLHPNTAISYHPALSSTYWHNETYNNHWYHGYPVYNNYWHHGYYPVNYPYYYQNYWYYNHYQYNNNVNDYLAAALVISLTVNALQAATTPSQTIYYPPPIYYYPYPGYYAPVPYVQAFPE